MKIKSLHIESYKHLENLQFDFTYPEGHSKAGKPLDKICFIGQSATGKTNILELIKDNYKRLDEIELANNDFLYRYINLGFEGSIEFVNEKESVFLGKNNLIKNGKKITLFSGSVANMTKLMNISLKLIYYTDTLISKASVHIFNESPINIFDNFKNEYLFKLITEKRIGFKYEFNDTIDPQIWYSLIAQITQYRKKFTQFSSELIHKGIFIDLVKAQKEYKKWETDNENPLLSFAKYFNPILEKLNLQVDLVNTEYSVPIKSKINDDVIPISEISTGTKGLLLSLFPLFQLDTKDALIIIDEPERSLFPDVQLELISHYKACAPEAQFIIATHSPFIAASFEPEERFILYFNSEGKVVVKRGESPIGDDPNDMLNNDFNVNYYNEFGKKAYKDYLELKKKVAQEKEPEKKKELLVKLATLGDKYNF